MHDWNHYERSFWKQGIEKIAGVDEAGRGPLAGPVVAAACILKKRAKIPGIDDSKKLTALQREQLFLAITKKYAVAWSYAWVSSEEIDRINILQASKRAMCDALNLLPIKPEFALIDAVTLADSPCPHLPIIHGDSLSQSIAAASVIAKVIRDGMMRHLHSIDPAWSFDRHKGYGTALHMELLNQMGPSPHHRRSFAPVKRFFEPAVS